MNPEDGTPGNRPPAPSASSRQSTLVLRTTRSQARIEGHNPDIWAEHDYAVVDPETDQRVGRIISIETFREPTWRGFLQTVPALPPHSGVANTWRRSRQRSSSGMPR